MWKIDFVLVRGCIWAVIPTHFTVETLVYDIGKVFNTKFGNITVLLIRDVKKGSKRWTQVEATATALTNIENASRFLRQSVFVPVR